MAVLSMWLRAQARTRWRAWLGLAVVLGIAMGAAITASAGARRTESAYPRFVEKQDGFDVILGGIATDDAAERKAIIEKIRTLPEVKDYQGGGGLFVSDRVILQPSGETIAFPEVFIGGLASTREFATVNRPRVVAGRLFNWDATDEAVADFTVADRLGLHLGQKIDVPLTNQETGASTIRRATIVGIIAAPWDMPAVGSTSFSEIELTPAFVRANAEFIATEEDAPSVTLKRGTADIPSFIHAVERLSSKVDVPGTLPKHLAGVRKTLRFEVSALWILAGLIGIASLAIIGQALARQAVLDSDDNEALRALAMTRGQLFGVAMTRAALIGFVAAAVAAVVAILASPVMPRGLARVVEPDPGISFDITALAIGAAATLAIALFASAGPAWRAAKALAPAAPERGSRTAQRLAGLGARPSVVTGIRLALEPGRGRRALPLRSTILGLSVALAAFWGAAVFTRSLDHLIADPSLQGFAWDAIVAGPGQAQLESVLAKDRDVAAYTAGGATNIVIQGAHLIPFTYAPGRIAPVILRGRPPRAADEIALGSVALRRFGKSVGDTITVALDSNENPGPGPMTYRIVGQTVVPPFYFEQVEPGMGSAITIDGIDRLDPGGPARRAKQDGLPLVIRYRAGINVRSKLASLRKDVGGFLFTLQMRQPGAELAGVSKSSGLPLTLTEILLFMAAATLVHALVSAVRKRRHDLAILKTLGFSSGQVRTAVLWQASTLVVLALLIGLPAGTALGRWAWVWFVGTLGLVPSTLMPAAVILIAVVAATLALGNLIAFLPGRSAARTKPALVLRTE
jgi:ABC-type lipoprotein release transport system permease subunit